MTMYVLIYNGGPLVDVGLKRRMKLEKALKSGHTISSGVTGPFNKESRSEEAAKMRGEIIYSTNFSFADNLSELTKFGRQKATKENSLMYPIMIEPEEYGPLMDSFGSGSLRDGMRRAYAAGKSIYLF